MYSLDYIARANSIFCSHNPCSRDNALGHITASGLVARDGKVLQIFHPHIKIWFQPGGHIDEGEDPIDAAIREVHEETGFICSSDPDYLDLIDIDVHEIPANSKKGEGSHLHIDLLYRLVVTGKSMPAEEIESNWFSIDQIQGERILRALKNLGS
jgi:8-oxo-dGTP pyrophosphatase MutT (NUDIX family)